jgi:cellulose synthase/poly-beta-1,6-N-acetylglucosamine synthase-like glycosyltransferase
MNVLFWVSLILFVYTFAGYPLLLVGLNKLVTGRDSGFHNISESERATIEVSDDLLPSVEVIVIVRNVEAIIRKKIENLLELDYPAHLLAITFVSDCSSDATASIIREYESKGVRCINNEFKSSKSAGLNQAISVSEAEILFLTDARQTHERDSLRQLVTHFSDEQVGAVSGELVLMEDDSNEFSKGMDAYWKYEKKIRSLESSIGSVPGVTGAIYAMKRAYYKAIPAETLLDDVLIPMNMILDGKRVLFDEKAVAFDIPSADVSREKIRKTRTLAGNWQLLELRPQLLNPFKNKIWLQFISHKILRLVAPLWLLLIFISSSSLLDSSFYQFIFVAQVFGYSLVFFGFFVPQLSKLPLVKTAQSFLLLMWFTVLGFWSFVTRKHLTIWK